MCVWYLKKNNNYIYINKCFWLTLLLKTSKVWGWYDFLFCFLNVSLILTKTLIYLIKNTLFIKTGILLNIIYDLRILEGFMHVNVSW